MGINLLRDSSIAGQCIPWGPSTQPALVSQELPLAAALITQHQWLSHTPRHRSMSTNL